MQHFAHALFTIGGRDVYKFIRLNLPSTLPPLSTIQTDQSIYRNLEKQTRFDDFCVRFPRFRPIFDRLFTLGLLSEFFGKLWLVPVDLKTEFSETFGSP